MTETLFGEESRFLPRPLIVVLSRERREWHIARAHVHRRGGVLVGVVCRSLEYSLARERRLSEIEERERRAAADTVWIRIPHPPPIAHTVAVTPPRTSRPEGTRAPDLRRVLFGAWAMGGAFVAIWLMGH